MKTKKVCEHNLTFILYVMFDFQKILCIRSSWSWASNESKW